MPNSSQAIDANNRATWTAQNSVTGLPERLRVEPITNALLVFIVADDGLTPTAFGRCGIDANNRSTLAGMNDVTGQLETLFCDDNGVLKILPV